MKHTTLESVTPPDATKPTYLCPVCNQPIRLGLCGHWAICSTCSFEGNDVMLALARTTRARLIAEAVNPLRDAMEKSAEYTCTACEGSYPDCRETFSACQVGKARGLLNSESVKATSDIECEVR